MRNGICFLSISAKSLRWEYYRGTGKGGQKRNKTDNCARCTHEKSEAQFSSEAGRSKTQNKKQAFEKLAYSNELMQWAFNLRSEKIGNARDIKIYCDSLGDESLDWKIEFYDLGPKKEIKRKAVKRKKVLKDKTKTDRKNIRSKIKNTKYD